MAVSTLRGVIVLLALSLGCAAADDHDPFGTCSPDEQSAYMTAVRQALLLAWVLPRDDESVSCTVLIAQNFRGEVLNAGVEDCPDDAELRKSVEDAAYDASPLPVPANRACFEPKLRLRLTHRAQPGS